jgi:hypothetical protein
LGKRAAQVEQVRRAWDVGQGLGILRRPEPKQADVVAPDPFQLLGEVGSLPRPEDVLHQLGADERHLLQLLGAGSEHFGRGTEMPQQCRGQVRPYPRHEVQGQQVLDFR